MPPYPERLWPYYLADGRTIFVLGGFDSGSSVNRRSDIWSTTDGRAWAQVGNTFPSIPTYGAPQGAAAFGGKLYTVCFDDEVGLPRCYSSADGAKTWVQQSTPILQSNAPIPGMVWLTLQPVSDKLLLLGLYDSNEKSIAMAMDSTATWSPAGKLSPPTMSGFNAWSTAIFRGYLWVSMVGQGASQPNARFFVYNQFLPDITFTLA
jgi:hypothetical protein